MSMSSSIIQSGFTERCPGDDVQDGEGEFQDLNAATVSYGEDCDLTEELQIGRKFNSFDKVKELLDKFKACGHPMRVFNVVAMAKSRLYSNNTV